jgi:hypothetical protein
MKAASVIGMAIILTPSLLYTKPVRAIITKPASIVTVTKRPMPSAKL